MSKKRKDYCPLTDTDSNSSLSMTSGVLTANPCIFVFSLTIQHLFIVDTEQRSDALKQHKQAVMSGRTFSSIKHLFVFV